MVSLPEEINNEYWSFIMKPFGASPRYALKRSVTIMVSRFL